MVRLALAGLLIAAAGCSGGDDAPRPAELDEPARQACEAFGPIGGEVRRGELEGPPLFRALQRIYDTARPSENTAVAQATQRLLTAAIGGDRQATSAAVTELQEACGLPFS